MVLKHKISVKFLEDDAGEYALLFKSLINLPIKLQSFPEDCKIVKCKPLKNFKGLTLKITVISLLPIISKIINTSSNRQLS